MAQSYVSLLVSGKMAYKTLVTTAVVFVLDRISLSLPFYHPKFILGKEENLNVIPILLLHYGRIKSKTFKWASIENSLEFLSELSECVSPREVPSSFEFNILIRG